jgi:carbon storage regulator
MTSSSPTGRARAGCCATPPASAARRLGMAGVGARAGRRRQGDQPMLVLTRKANQSIMIGDRIELFVLSIMGEKVRIGIDAPRDIPVFRKEVYLEIQQENTAAGTSAAARSTKRLGA